MAVLLVVIAVSVGSVSVTHKLNRQVQKLVLVEQVDELRESLEHQQHLIQLAPRDTSGTRVGELLSALLTAIEPLFDKGDETFAQDAKALTERAAQLHDEFARLRQIEIRQATDLRAQLAALKEQNRKWSANARLLAFQGNREAQQADSRQRQIGQNMADLTKRILSAERLRRKIGGIFRMMEIGGPLGDTAIDWSGMTAPELTAACAVESRDRACRPSPNRVLAALEYLRSAPPEGLGKALNNALRAVDAYARAGEIAMRDLSAALIEVGDQSAALQEETEQIQTLSRAALRFRGAMDNIGSILDETEHASAERLTDLDGLIVGAVSQSLLRGRQLASHLGATGEEERTSRALARFGEEWTPFLETVRQRENTVRQFGQVMNQLADEITQSALSFRQATGLWSAVFASSVLIASSATVILIGAAIWLARARFAAPLALLTQAIIDLSEGRLEINLKIQRSISGFNDLRAAIERLRAALVHRNVLEANSALQKREIQRNLEDLQDKTREIEHQSLHDPLTGLPNRRFADLHLEERTKAATNDGPSFTLLHLDLDRFKEINDSLGHQAGDFVLQHVARVLRRIIGEQGQTFRISGDEFLISLPLEHDHEAACDIAENVIAALNERVTYEGHVCRIGASIGIAFGEDADFDAAATLMNADLALYEAKRNGRNCFQLFERDLQIRSRQRNSMADRLRRAIENEEFVPFYQPQLFAADLQLRGLETLCRWQDPEMGWIAPGEFLNIAEELSMVGRIDQILVEKAAEDLEHLKRQGLLVPMISFNITADRLLHADLARTLTEAIGPDTRVSVELLESMSFDSLNESVRWAIDALKESNIAVEIDDFGSCRASLAGLMAVRPHALKIDQAIIRPSVNSETHQELIRAIIEIGHALDIEVVAEGVESDDHTNLLRQMGCGVLQGFALARPMPVGDLEQFLRNHQPEMSRRA